MNEPIEPVLTFDSGLGGLSVFRHLTRLLPLMDHIYVADDLSFPVGGWDEAALTDHCLRTMDELIKQYQPRLVVIACNTESTLILEPLRAVYDVPFVGTVPAIKPAAEQTQSGLISILATPGTVKRDYTRDLMDTYASACDVKLIGADKLATYAETYMREGRVDEAAVWSEIAGCFVEEQGRRTDVVALACTHYPLLMPVFEKLAPWPVTWLDPAPAIARRAACLLGPEDKGNSTRLYLMTSGLDFPDVVFDD